MVEGVKFIVNLIIIIMLRCEFKVFNWLERFVWCFFLDNVESVKYVKLLIVLEKCWWLLILFINYYFMELFIKLIIYLGFIS